jgi:hypothetical protein
MDNGIHLTEHEKRFYYSHGHGIKDNNTVNFILNGCDLPDSEKPTNPNVGYMI